MNKNTLNNEFLLKALSAPVNYNEEARKMGFSGTGDKIKLAIIGSGLPDHLAIHNIGKSISFSNESTIDDTTGESSIISGILIANDVKTITGVCPKATANFAKVTDNSGKIATESIISSILWSIIKKVDIIVIPMIMDVSLSLDEAVQKAYSSNIAIVCYAGPKEHYENIITVGTLAQDKTLFNTSYSGHVNVIGTTIMSTHIKQNFIIASGEICSTAFAAGLLALQIASYKSRPEIGKIYKDFIAAF